MSTPTPSIPVFTRATAYKLIGRLGKSLNIVEESQAIADPDKQNIRNLIIPLMSSLYDITRQATSDADLDAVPWATDEAPNFAKLALLLQAALGLAAPDIGACRYTQNGVMFCIMTNRDTCDTLGSFDSGGTC